MYNYDAIYKTNSYDILRNKTNKIQKIILVIEIIKIKNIYYLKQLRGQDNVLLIET